MVPISMGEEESVDSPWTMEEKIQKRKKRDIIFFMATTPFCFSLGLMVQGRILIH